MVLLVLRGEADGECFDGGCGLGLDDGSES